MRLIRSTLQYPVADQLIAKVHHLTRITRLDAIAKNSGTPRELIITLLHLTDLHNIPATHLHETAIWII